VKLRTVLIGGGALVLAAVMAYAGLQLWSIHTASSEEAGLHTKLLAYKPTISPGTTDDNPRLSDMRLTYPDVVGWLSIPHTRIDYPFVQGRDNDEYLHRDMNQQASAAGTIFLDYRNTPTLTDLNSVIFGHHMRSGAMFATLRSFTDKSFFDANPAGTIFLPDATYTVQFIAFAEIKPDDQIIYDTGLSHDQASAFLAHVKAVARHYRDVGATSGDRFITLSSCDYEFANARMVLIGRLMPL